MKPCSVVACATVALVLAVTAPTVTRSSTALLDPARFAAESVIAAITVVPLLVACSIAVACATSATPVAVTLTASFRPVEAATLAAVSVTL